MAVLFVIVALLGVTRARAGLEMTLNIQRFNNPGSQGCLFYAYVQTNNTPPNVSFGSYLVVSPGYPTNANASWTQCQFDTNGFSDVGVGYNVFSNFDAPDMAGSMIQNITNGQWSIFVTNATTTNVYYFTVTATIGSNDVPLVEFTYPTNGATGVTNQPTLTWEAPTNYSQMFLAGPNPADPYSGQFLPPTQTSISGLTLNDGLNRFTLDTYYYATNGLVSSVPVDTNSNPISSWVSNWSEYDYATIQFMVGPPVDTAGTAHTLVAYYTWDATNADGSASGADSSGNGYNMNFSGSFGSEGGVNWTTNAIVGPGAIQFADGDDYSGAYVGWSETPTNLLATMAGSFSISCWVNTTQGVEYAGNYAQSGVGIVSASTGGLANDVIPLELIGGQAAFNTGGSVEDDTLTSNGSVNDGNNHLVVVTRNQLTGQKIIYIDGVLDQYGFGTTNLLTDAQLLTIGSLANATDPYAADAYYYNGYAGVLDDLQIYSGVLSSNEAATLYANPGTTLPNTVVDTLTVTASPLSGPAPLTVQFTSPGVDSLGNAVTNWVWTFGDGGTSTNESPVHTYASPGSYTPGLLAQSVGGWLPTVGGPGVIAVSGTQPQATFTAAPLAGPAPLAVQFTGPSVDSAGNTITNWAWSFGDGAISTAQNPLTIYDPLGGSVSDNFSPSLVVQSSGGYDLVATGPGPVVVSPAYGGTIFSTAGPSSGPAPLSVHFSSSATDTSGNTATNWVWVFGDGATSTNQNPTHTYSVPNYYSPSLVVECRGGLFASVVGPGLILVTNPVLAVTENPRAGAAPLTVQFTSPATDSGGNTVTRWSWSFGDGAVSTEQNPTHTYAGTGNYNPSLVANSFDVQTPLNVTGLAGITVTNAANPVANLPGSPASFTFNNFANAASLQLNGSARALTTGDGPVLELTPSTSFQAGTAFVAKPIPFGPNLSFSTFFLFRLQHPGGIAAADGITFTVQGDNSDDVGAAGGRLGYIGIPDSFCVDFKTYDDGTLFGSPGDPNNNYVGLNVNGGLNNPIYTTITNAPLSDGNIWYAWIDYEGVSQDLEVRLSETPARPLAPTLDVVVNLQAVLGGATNAYVGFTGGTGDGWQEQDILAWKFTALPTTRLTGTMSLTNLPAGTQITNGMVMMEYKYDLDGVDIINYVWVPVAVTTNIGVMSAFSSNPTDLSVNALDAAVNSNAQAIDQATSGNNNGFTAFNPYYGDLGYLAFMPYQSSSSPDLSPHVPGRDPSPKPQGSGATSGIMVCSYNNGSGYPAYLQGVDFGTVFPGAYDESDFLNALNAQMAANPGPNMVPVGIVTQVAAANPQLWASPDPSGHYSTWNTLFSDGVNVGTMTVRQQVLAGPPLPLVMVSPRADGTNFFFDFGTVQNQNYTVWASTNLATTNWVSYTNVVGDGYIQETAVPLTNGVESFFRLSSP
jgi:PKD repeat protein